MKLIEWEVNEDNYQEQIVIPEAQKKLAADQGISLSYCSDISLKTHFLPPKTGR